MSLTIQNGSRPLGHTVFYHWNNLLVFLNGTYIFDGWHAWSKKCRFFLKTISIENAFSMLRKVIKMSNHLFLFNRAHHFLANHRSKYLILFMLWVNFIRKWRQKYQISKKSSLANSTENFIVKKVMTGSENRNVKTHRYYVIVLAARKDHMNHMKWKPSKLFDEKESAEKSR